MEYIKLIKTLLIFVVLLSWSGLYPLCTARPTEIELASGTHQYQMKLKVRDENSAQCEREVTVSLIGTHHWYPLSGFNLPEGFLNSLENVSVVTNETTTLLDAQVLHRNLLLMRDFPWHSTFYNAFAQKSHGVCYSSDDNPALSFFKNHLPKKINADFFKRFGINTWDQTALETVVSHQNELDRLPPALIYETVYAFIKCQSVEQGLLTACPASTKKITLDGDMESKICSALPLEDEKKRTLLSLSPQVQDHLLAYYSNDEWRFRDNNETPEFLSPDLHQALTQVTYCAPEDRERVTDAIKVYKMLKNKTKKLQSIRADRKTYFDHVMQYDQGFFKDAPEEAQATERNLTWLKKPLLDTLMATPSASKVLVMFGADHLMMQDQRGILNFFIDQHLGINQEMWRQALGANVFNQWQKIQITSIERYVNSSGYVPLIQGQVQLDTPHGESAQ